MDGWMVGWMDGWMVYSLSDSKIKIFKSFFKNVRIMVHMVKFTIKIATKIEINTTENNKKHER